MRRTLILCLIALTLACACAYAAGVNVLFRRGTSAAWTAANPILQNGEPGYETDTGLLKVGTGIATWSALPYFSGNIVPVDTSVTPIFLNASTSSQVLDIKTYTNIEVYRTDGSKTHTVTIQDSTPIAVPVAGLLYRGDGIHLRKAAGVWYTDTPYTPGSQKLIEYLNASVTSTVEISPYAEVTVCKSDTGAGTITLTDSVHSNSLFWGPITIQGECLHLLFSGSAWYRP